MLFKIDSNFQSVIQNCAEIRSKNIETWINESIINTYFNMHKLGYAHSVECWINNELVGGLYGLHLGGCFFGESMFSKIQNTS